MYNPKNNTVWWEGLDKYQPGDPNKQSWWDKPAEAIDWKGNPWKATDIDAATGKPVKGAHPNSRFTAPTRNCPCLSTEFEAKKGVPISAMIFGGRRAKAAPLVYQSFDWKHGVFVGATMASETTAAATGAVGVVRHDPMAMLPFCGYHMCDYFQHWLDMGKKCKTNAPKIFNVNWFRTDANGDFIWPGYGDNMRVLDWIIRRCEDTVDARSTAIGFLPYAKDINIEGIANFSIEQLASILDVEKKVWKAEVKDIKAYFANTFGDRLPRELKIQLNKLNKRVNEIE
jgi:phosphoenolpyruvate carboxykinase (GTP)